MPPQPTFGKNDILNIKPPRLRRMRRPKAKYEPSLIGMELGIRATDTKGPFTGFEIRGIPRRKG